MRPCPSVHSDLAALVAFAVADEHGTAIGVEVNLVERKRFADPQPSAPQHDDHAAQPQAVGAVPGGSHDGDDLLDRGRVGWVAKSLVSRRHPLMEAG